MQPTTRTAAAGTRRYRIAFEYMDIRHVDYMWPEEVDAALAADIVALMRLTTSAAPIIGFGKQIDDAQAEAYIGELRANLAAGKCRLLEIRGSNQALIGLCTIRRNLNPNNGHIADLAKGMIDERCRGGTVLSAAFLEMSDRCLADGVEVMTLDVRAGTRAQRIWEHYGFETYGVLPDYARSNGESFAGHFMTQKVQALKARVARQLEHAGVGTLEAAET
jgi:ribosomal protein S18 acetylase RimI-like enzyme